jgi:dihydroflavonol-4-reductase
VKALVTGAAGFIGAHVVRALLDAGHEVRAAYLPGDRALNLEGLAVERAPLDVLDRGALREAMRGCGWVFHLAAIYALWSRDPARMWDVNVVGTRNVLELAGELGVERVIHTSSIARFGGQGPDRDATEDSPFALGSTGDLYARSKADAHELALAHARRGQDVVLVAPCAPVGPGDVGPTPTGKLLLSAIDLPVMLAVDTWACVGDVRAMARAHLAAAERGQRGRCYLLGSENVSQLDLARRVQAIVGVRRPLVRVPFAAAEAVGRGAEVVARWTGQAPLFTAAAVRITRLGLRARCDRAAAELGMPQGPIDDALRDALRWFAERGYLRDAEARRRLLA